MIFCRLRLVLGDFGRFWIKAWYDGGTKIEVASSPLKWLSLKTYNS